MQDVQGDTVTQLDLRARFSGDSGHFLLLQGSRPAFTSGRGMGEGRPENLSDPVAFGQVHQSAEAFFTGMGKKHQLYVAIV